MARQDAKFSFAHAIGIVARLSLVQVGASRCREGVEAIIGCLALWKENEHFRAWEQGQEPFPAQGGVAAEPC